MAIDDVSVVRVIRPGERKLAPVPSDCQARVAFAAGTDGEIVLDGAFDGPADLVRFGASGFRRIDEERTAWTGAGSRGARGRRRPGRNVGVSQLFG